MIQIRHNLNVFFFFFLLKPGRSRRRQRAVVRGRRLRRHGVPQDDRGVRPGDEPMAAVRVYELPPAGRGRRRHACAPNRELHVVNNLLLLIFLPVLFVCYDYFLLRFASTFSIYLGRFELLCTVFWFCFLQLLLQIILFLFVPAHSVHLDPYERFTNCFERLLLCYFSKE